MKKKRNVLYAGVVATLIILLLFNFAVLCFAINMEEEAKGNAGGGGIVFDPNSSDERPSEGPGTSPGVTVAGFSGLTIPAGVDTIAIDMYNPKENNGLYYMTFTLSLIGEDGSAEVLFKTGYVAPGKHIYQVTLSRALPAGEYNARLLVQPYRMGDLSPTNNVSAVVALTVK